MPQWFPPRKLRRPAFRVGIMARKQKTPKPRAATSTDRRAAALRENLRRRKRQRRLRDEADAKAPGKTDG